MTEDQTATADEIGTAPEPNVWTVRCFTATGVSDDEARTQAVALLRDQIRDEGYVIVEESVQAREIEYINLSDGEGGYVTWDGRGEYDGKITTWTSLATLRVVDDSPIDPLDPDAEVRRFTVPEEYMMNGGTVSLRHRLGGPVTVYAYGPDGSKVGYLVAVEIDENIEQVELLPGVASLTAERDPDEE